MPGDCRSFHKDGNLTESSKFHPCTLSLAACGKSGICRGTVAVFTRTVIGPKCGSQRYMGLNFTMLAAVENPVYAWRLSQFSQGL